MMFYEFRGLAPFEIGGERLGLLLCVPVHQSELAFARREGTGKLKQRLEGAGVRSGCAAVDRLDEGFAKARRASSPVWSGLAVHCSGDAPGEGGEGVSHSDDVREYCGTHYVDQARGRGERSIAIRAGDVHAAMGYKNRLPLVCAALGAKLFEDQYRVRRTAIEGPTNGSTTTFRFEVLA